MQGITTRPRDTIDYLNTLASDRQSGEVLLQCGEQTAKVYLNSGLIVWAFASGQDESFQSILLKENYLSKEQLLDGIKKARADGKRSLDEILVSLGIADQKLRRTIIERHTRAALKVIRTWQDVVAQFNIQEAVEDQQRIGGIGLATLVGERTDSSTETAESNGIKAPAPGGRPTARPSYHSEIAVAPAKDLPELLERIRQEVPNFIATMIIDNDTGMPIVMLSDAPGLDMEIVSAFYRDVSKSALEGLRAMGKSIDGTTLEEVLITSAEEYVLLRCLKNGELLLYLLIDQESNPGMARVVIKRYIDQLEAFLS